MWIVKNPEGDLENDLLPLFGDNTQRVNPRWRDSGSASNTRGIFRSPSPPGRQYPDPIWKRQMRTMPVEHSKFIWDIVSYISNLQAFLSSNCLVVKL